MGELTKKQQRIIDFALDRLFSPKSIFVPTSIKDISAKDFFSRQLRLADNRTIMLTDAGVGHVRIIVATIEEADVFDGLASYTDIWAAFHNLIETFLSEEMRPDNGVELLQLLKNKLNSEINNHSYAVPLYGLKMEGVDSITIGPIEIVASLQSHLEAARIRHNHVNLSKILEANSQYLWLVGSERGTPRVSQEKFSEQAALAVGMLAVHAGAIYDRGASAFRIGVVMSPEEGHERAVWFSWEDIRDALLTAHCQFIKSQPFVIDDSVSKELASNNIVVRAFEIFRSDKKTDLEKAITNAIYWYSDAHRDIVLTMKLIKYWSCVETFFSMDKKDITKSVSIGLTAVLVYGGYKFVPEKEYISFKKRIAKLYDLRSHAVHRASYKHVSERDISELSQWIAWMIINMISFVERGYTQVEQIMEVAVKFDKSASHS